MNNRTIDGIKIQVSLAKRQFHLPSSKGSNSSSPSSSGSESPAASTSGGGNVSSWSMIAANFSAGSATAGSKSAAGVKKDGNKASRELIVYEDDIPDD